MKYELLLPRKILFGWGRRAEIGALAAPLGKRAFLVNGSRTLAAAGVIEDLRAQLRSAGVDSHLLTTIAREPEVADVDQAVDLIRAQGLEPGDFVIGVGGGAALDLAKAVAALAPDVRGASVLDFLEGVGRGYTIDRRPLPFLAIPTTAGTGSEATKNAVISSYSPAFKKSLRSDAMLAAAVLIDPELTVSVPRNTTAHTGMDAITQLIESYVSCRAQPVPQAFCLEGLAQALPALARAVADGACRPAREAMAHAAWLSGLALANSGLGLAHGVAAALGVLCRVPHGLACAVMLPAAIRVNTPARLREFATLGRLLTGRADLPDAGAAAAFGDRIAALCAELGIPSRLRDIGVTADQIPALVPASRGNSMSGNPRLLDDDELTRLLEDML